MVYYIVLCLHHTINYQQDGAYELGIRNYFQAIEYAEYAEDKKEVAEIYDALNYYEEKKDTSAILLCYVDISRTYRSLGNYDKALETINNCNRYLSENKFGNKFRILYRYNNLGVAYSYLKNFILNLHFGLVEYMILKEIQIPRISF